MGSSSVDEKAAVQRAAQFPGDTLWVKSWRICPGEATIRKRMNTLSPQLTFYSSWFCPFAQRTWIALEESGVKYKWNEINPYIVDSNEPGGYTKKSLSLDEKRKLYPEFIDASPRGLVPALSHTVNDDDGAQQRFVWESLPAAEYVDAVFGNGSLIPADPYEKALVQIWCDHCTNRVQHQFYKALMAQDPAKRQEHLQHYYTECRALANAMSTEGPFFLGNRFSMLEVVLAPFWQRMLWVGGHYLQLFAHDAAANDEEPAFERLRRWWTATCARPSVAATLVGKPRLIASYADYARNAATSDFARSVTAVAAA